MLGNALSARGAGKVKAEKERKRSSQFFPWQPENQQQQPITSSSSNLHVNEAFDDDDDENEHDDVRAIKSSSFLSALISHIHSQHTERLNAVEVLSKEEKERENILLLFSAETSAVLVVPSSFSSRSSSGSGRIT